MILTIIAFALVPVLVLPALWMLKTMMSYFIYPVRLFSKAESKKKSVPASCGVQFWLPEEAVKGCDQR